MLERALQPRVSRMPMGDIGSFLSTHGDLMRVAAPIALVLLLAASATFFVNSNKTSNDR